MRQDEGGGIGRTYTGFPPPFDLHPCAAPVALFWRMR